MQYILTYSRNTVLLDSFYITFYEAASPFSSQHKNNFFKQNLHAV
jgi:hypothetical protein